ncbi:MAG: nucleotidyltransferase domain-containing protein [Spirochaetales bacterium]|nr:nucleotidyltransferase domain-containing protein [Spirochaetales bacterium]
MDTERLLELVQNHYGQRLQSLALFGSRATGTHRPDSDADLLLVIDPLPTGRMARSAEWLPLEENWPGPFLSPLFYTPAELQMGSPAFFGMTLGEVAILYDHQGLLASYIEDLRRRLKEMGARRIGVGRTAYWDMGRPGGQVVL